MRACVHVCVLWFPIYNWALSYACKLCGVFECADAGLNSRHVSWCSSFAHSQFIAKLIFLSLKLVIWCSHSPISEDAKLIMAYRLSDFIYCLSLNCEHLNANQWIWKLHNMIGLAISFAQKRLKFSEIYVTQMSKASEETHMHTHQRHAQQLRNASNTSIGWQWEQERERDSKWVSGVQT